MMRPLGQLDAHNPGIGKEGRIDERNHDDDPFHHGRRQESVKKLQVDMGSFAYTGNRSDKAEQDQQIACDLFGPCQGTVEGIPRKKLDENDNQQGPKNNENRRINPFDIRNIVRYFHFL